MSAGSWSPGTRVPGAAVATTAAHGRVVTPEGWPVAGATVTVLGADGAQLASGTAGDDGRFTLDGLPAGAGTLLVAAPAHAPKAMTVVVPAGPSWTVGELRLTRRGGTDVPAPGLYLLDTAHSTVSAKAHHLGLATVSGRFTEFAGAITVDADVARSRVDAEIVAASIETGNAQRDAHLRSPDFLDVERFPTLRFEADRLERGGAGWVLPGRLTLAGTTRPVQLDLSYLGSGPDPWGGTRAAFSATAELRRQDFQLNWNQAVGVGIAVFGTTLRVTIDVEAVLQP
ncbi:Polyisoprenoid-binding protein YceI [Friedmanniella luteola]|uniref:Polyisoprenoid-binding protein YceI n=1 Tax=Friedmanniella luteola TaxID=546871 RepID=A0A1H1M4B8_9ACTN|nr:YceI family protein [Friedmanniella luteola]SDR81352.1 Polyisoprenoid-binding protein YceI [Friedmanniella luteola]